MPDAARKMKARMPIITKVFVFMIHYTIEEGAVRPFLLLSSSYSSKEGPRLLLYIPRLRTSRVSSCL